MDNKINKEEQYDYMFKLILVGAASVGKSNILLRYTKNQFFEGIQTTIGVEYATKTITTKNNKRIKFQIWDTAGQQRYRALMKTYYKGSSAALIVYDLTREETFLNLENQQKLLKQYIKSDVITMIVGNKCDMEEKRTVSKQRGLEYAEDKKIAFYQVSAKEGTNVDLIFTRVAEELEKVMEKPSTSILKNGVNKSQQIKPDPTIRLTYKQQKKKNEEKLNKKSSCCSK